MAKSSPASRVQIRLLAENLDEQIELKEKLQESLIKTLDSKQELASEVKEVVTNLEEKFDERFHSSKAQDADHTENDELLGEVSQKIEKSKNQSEKRTQVSPDNE